MADLIAITKADGENIQKANSAKVQYESALHLFPPAESGWAPRVRTCSSLTKDGINEVWNQINDYVTFTKSNGYFNDRRLSQSKYWMYQTIEEAIRGQFYTNPVVVENLPKLEKLVLDGKLSSFSAAKKIIDISKQ